MAVVAVLRSAQIGHCAESAGRIELLPSCLNGPHHGVRRFRSRICTAASRAWVAAAMASRTSSGDGPGARVLRYSKLFRARRMRPKDLNALTVEELNCAWAAPGSRCDCRGWSHAGPARPAGSRHSSAARRKRAGRRRTGPRITRRPLPWPGAGQRWPAIAVRRGEPACVGSQFGSQFGSQYQACRRGARPLVSRRSLHGWSQARLPRQQGET